MSQWPGAFEYVYECVYECVYVCVSVCECECVWVCMSNNQHLTCLQWTHCWRGSHCFHAYVQHELGSSAQGVHFPWLSTQYIHAKAMIILTCDLVQL